eukprot:scaffold76374_cov58-Phaeocystis_antarctica.AAC.3
MLIPELLGLNTRCAFEIVARHIGRVGLAVLSITSASQHIHCRGTCDGTVAAHANADASSEMVMVSCRHQSHASPRICNLSPIESGCTK